MRLRIARSSWTIRTVDHQPRHREFYRRSNRQERSLVWIHQHLSRQSWPINWLPRRSRTKILNPWTRNKQSPSRQRRWTRHLRQEVQLKAHAALVQMPPRQDKLTMVGLLRQLSCHMRTSIVWEQRLKDSCSSCKSKRPSSTTQLQPIKRTDRWEIRKLILRPKTFKTKLVSLNKDLKIEIDWTMASQMTTLTTSMPLKVKMWSSMTKSTWHELKMKHLSNSSMVFWSMKRLRETIQRLSMPRRLSNLQHASVRAPSRMSRNSTPSKCSILRFKILTWGNCRSLMARSSQQPREARSLMRGGQRRDKHLPVTFRL
jgi:hypothetical protein